MIFLSVLCGKVQNDKMKVAIPSMGCREKYVFS
eukprot:UN13913